MRGHGHGAEDGSSRDIGVVKTNSAPGDFIAKRRVEFAATEGDSKYQNFKRRFAKISQSL